MVHKILSGQHWDEDKQLTLIFDHVTWISKGVSIYSIEESTESSLGGSKNIQRATSVWIPEVKLKGSRNIEKTTFFQRSAVWPLPLAMWPENQ